MLMTDLNRSFQKKPGVSRMRLESVFPSLGRGNGSVLCPLAPAGEMNPRKGSFQKFDVSYHVINAGLNGTQISAVLIKTATPPVRCHNGNVRCQRTELFCQRRLPARMTHAPV